MLPFVVCTVRFHCPRHSEKHEVHSDDIDTHKVIGIGVNLVLSGVLIVEKAIPYPLSEMQLVLPPEIEAFVQRQVESGKYSSPLVEVAITAFQRMQEQDEDIYQGRLSELQEDARIGLEAYERGEIVDGPTAMVQIRSNLHNRYQKAPEAQEE